jgi:phage terminase Nu1 subunit (DNA packaging protein)
LKVTQIHVAEHLFLSQTQVSQMQTRGLFKIKEGGGYDLAECRRNYIEYLKAVKKGSMTDIFGENNSSVLNLTEQRARDAKASADAREIKNAVARGELVEIEPFTQRIIGMIEETKGRLYRVPAIVAGRDADLRERIQQAIEDVLTEVSETRVMEATSDGFEDAEEDPEAAAIVVSEDDVI